MSLNMKKIDRIMVEVRKEFIAATEKFGSFHNYHEGYGVTLEELDEVWDEVKGEQRPEQLRLEAKQVAAMAFRFIYDLCPEYPPDPVYTHLQMEPTLKAAENVIENYKQFLCNEKYRDLWEKLNFAVVTIEHMIGADAMSYPGEEDYPIYYDSSLSTIREDEV